MIKISGKIANIDVDEICYNLHLNYTVKTVLNGYVLPWEYKAYIGTDNRAYIPEYKYTKSFTVCTPVLHICEKNEYTIIAPIN